MHECTTSSKYTSYKHIKIVTSVRMSFLKPIFFSTMFIMCTCIFKVNLLTYFIIPTEIIFSLLIHYKKNSEIYKESLLDYYESVSLPLSVRAQLGYPV